MSPRAAARLAWATVALTFLLTAACAAIQLTNPPEAGELYPQFPGFVDAFAVGAVGGAVGALIVSRHPGNAVGWIFCGSGLAVAFTSFGLHYSGRALLVAPGSLPAGHEANWLVVVVQLGWVPLFTFLPLLFPDGRLPSRRWRPLAWATGLVMAGLAVVLAAGKGRPGEAVPGQSTPPDRLLAVALAVLSAALLGLILACAVALLLRLRRARGDERRQLRWFVTAAALLAVAATINAAGILLYGEAQPWGQAAVAMGGAAVPVAAGVAIFKYRLYDIDLIINRAVVLLALASFITGGYVLVVAGVGQVLGGRWASSGWLALAATAAVALAFQPARRRLQRLADRLVYGPRAAPYEVLAGFTDRVAGALRVDEVLPRMAEAAAQGVGAARARVTLLLTEGRRVVSWPPEAPPDGPVDRVVAVLHRGQPVGELAVAMPPGRALTRAEDRLLSDLAGQGGLALRNARLAIDLEDRAAQLAAQAGELAASRQRLVQAQDQERRRLAAALRRGPDRQLAAIAGQLRLAEEALGRDPAAATALLDALDGEAERAVDALRDLARGLFPSLLADQGLLAAVAALARRMAPAAVVEAGPGAAGRLPAQVETAAYFCCREALDNATRHAAGAPVAVCLEVEAGWLEFSVTDAGPGFDPTAVGGTGLQHMTDRVEALAGTLLVSSPPAGGARVVGRIPLRAAAAGA
jgi:signal transduction histidine kinase